MCDKCERAVERMAVERRITRMCDKCERAVERMAVERMAAGTLDIFPGHLSPEDRAEIARVAVMAASLEATVGALTAKVVVMRAILDDLVTFRDGTRARLSDIETVQTQHRQELDACIKTVPRDNVARFPIDGTGRPS